MDPVVRARRARRGLTGLMLLAWVSCMGAGLIQLTRDHPAGGHGSAVMHVTAPLLMMVSVTALILIVGRAIRQDISVLAGRAEAQRGSTTTEAS